MKISYYKLSCYKLAILCGLLVAQASFGQGIKVLANHLGYEPAAPKRAVILGRAGDVVTGRTGISGRPISVP
jgi:hypothetical protein